MTCVWKSGVPPKQSKDNKPVAEHLKDRPLNSHGRYRQAAAAINPTCDMDE